MTSANQHNNETTLHLLCGKIASGKSTLAATLSAVPGTVLVSEDYWLAQLFADQMKTVADYVHYSEKLRNAMAPHIVSLLQAGTSVVLDFPANTKANRQWMKEIIDRAAVPHQLHLLDVPDEVCKSRLHARNQSGTHDFEASDAQFELITRYFVKPEKNEGFNIIHYPHP